MMTHVHLIGIGGMGLSAIARVLLEKGYTVSGSDRNASPLFQRLAQDGARVYLGHRANGIQGADIVVRSSAISDDNVEVQAAKDLGIPVYRRAEFLPQLMSGYQTIAVAGTHGKSTTTAMIVWMLTALGKDPSYIIGGVLANLGVNAHAGKGRAFVIEADEYDNMFWGLAPEIAVVTNVEHDHPDCFPSYEAFYSAFWNFVGRLTPSGVLLSCGDDPGAARLHAQFSALGRQAFTYGQTSTDLTYRAQNVQAQAGGGMAFETWKGDQHLVDVHLQVVGRHNVSNALAALAVADQLGLPVSQGAEALAEFIGVGRRFEHRGQVQGIEVIDDYAHHPSEIQATLAAARTKFPQRRLWAVWQPHTYSRTRLFFQEFAQAFSDADHVVVTEVYPAREPFDPEFSSRQIVQTMEHPSAHFVSTIEEASAFLLERLQPGDVLLVLSAGDGNQICDQVLAGLKAAER